LFYHNRVVVIHRLLQWKNAVSLNMITWITKIGMVEQDNLCRDNYRKW